LCFRNTSTSSPASRRSHRSHGRSQSRLTSFAVIDFFPDDSGRQAHLSGSVAEALLARADELLARPPEITPLDVIAAKLPG
jgi:hypothetical protein